ncbi:MAG: hypothetical protein WC516_05705 [Patescibacteria group bacterium]
MTDIEKQVKILKNMVQNKNRSLIELEREAKKIVFKKHVDIKSRFKKASDQKEADKIFDHYINNYPFETLVEYKIVGDLVYEEILLIHLKDALDEIANNENNNFIPEKEVKALHDTQAQISYLQEKLGITKAEKKDDLSVLETLKKKFAVYIPFNRNEFTAYVPLLCNNCGHFDVQPRLFRRRVKDFDCLVHPSFSGRFLYNYIVIDAVKNGTITKKLAADILRTSERYIEWVIENENKIIEIDGVEEQRIIEYINSNPNLRHSTYYNQPK